MGVSGFYTPDQCRWNPKDDRILLAYSLGAQILDPDTGDLRILQDVSGEPVSDAHWSPEGDSVWYWRADDIQVMAVSGGAPRPSGLSQLRQVGGWSFAPAGTTIAFATYTPDDAGHLGYHTEIALIRRDGQGYEELTELGGIVDNPTWIHNGSEILFDYIPIECAGTYPNVERQWLAVDVHTRRLRRLGQYLGSARFQFSFPIAVNPSGDVAVVVGPTPEHTLGWKYGVLYTTPIEYPHMTLVFRPGSSRLP